MRRGLWALMCLIGAVVLVAGACTPPGGPGNTPPTAVIDASPTSGAPPLEVTFSASNSTDVGGSIASYLWDFGDGDTSGLENVTHTYATAGTYTVTLTVTDNLGKTDSATVDIVVGSNQPPTVTAAADVTSGLAPLTVNFTSSAADPDGTIASVEWNFGDGDNSTDADPTHTYTNPGTFAATVTATDDEGAVTSDSVTITVSANQAPTASANASPNSGKAPLTVNFDGSASSDPDNAIVAYDWDFGDTNTGSGATPIHTYMAQGTYTVTLTVTDELGATDSTTLTIVAADNVAPLANIQATPTSGHAPLQVHFDGTSSTDSDGTIVSYEWDFGDTNTDTGATPTHTYASSGTYVATLTVTDDNGATGTDTITINVGVPNVAPTAVASANPTSGPEVLVVNFDSSGSSDPDGTIASTVWNFGDGDTSASANPTHTYTTAGSYTVSLTVTDDDGATDTDSLTITVTPNQAPTASASANPLTAKVGTQVAFDGSGSSDPDGTIASYAWDFDDGDSSSAVSPNHTFNTVGTYNVSLTVTDDDGATDTTSVTVTVVPNQAPSAAISANPQTGAYPLLVSFDSSASVDPDGTIASVAWNFGDGGTSSDPAPDHTYNSAGTFTATLTVTDDNGATGNASVTITVVQDNDGDGYSPPTDCDDTDNGIYPGAPDPLDGAGVDSNCDGLDGIASDTVLVDSGAGTDNGACGVLGSPCATIDYGIAKGKGVVQVASGSYGSFTLTGDVIVRGGYESDFDGRSGTTTVTGNGTGVLVSGATAGSKLMNLAINSGNPSGAGASAYGVRALSSTVAIDASTITAAAGNPGVAGSTPSGGLTPGTNGSSGSNGGRHSVPGGATGGGTGANAGGNGGNGEGIAGANGANGGSGGSGGCNNCVSNSSYSGGGAAGGAKGPNGSTGSAGSAGAAVFAGTYSPTNGTGGGAGGNGGGGGGGGGGGRACDYWACAGQWTGGGAGGKGGGGGQGGGGGTGGTSGGGSFAVYSHNSSVVIDANTTLSTADGGNGGNGGSGQLGATGGSGGNGGTGAKADNVTGTPGSAGSGGAPNTNGGNGGNGAAGTCCNAASGGGGGGGGGGNGGAGGAGGGGAGGPSIAMLKTGSGSITFGGDVGTQVSIGSGGSGGTGGNNGAAGQATKALDVP